MKRRFNFLNSISRNLNFFEISECMGETFEPDAYSQTVRRELLRVFPAVKRTIREVEVIMSTGRNRARSHRKRVDSLIEYTSKCIDQCRIDLPN